MAIDVAPRSWDIGGNIRVLERGAMWGWCILVVLVIAAMPGVAGAACADPASYISAIGSLASAAKALADNIAELDDRLKKLGADLQKLVLEKNNVLEDLRRGFYCNQCWHSKTQIEQAGENFETHLQNVHGEKVPAPPEKIQAAEEEYDQKIATLQSQIDSVSSQRNQLRTQHQDIVTRQLPNQVIAWTRAINCQSDLISAKWERADAGLEAETNALRRDMAKTTDPDLLRLLRNRMFQVGEQRERARFASNQERTQLDQAKALGIQTVGAALRNANTQFLVPIVSEFQGAPPLPLSAGPVSMTIAADQLSLKLGLGKTAATVQLKEDFFTSTETLSATLDFMGLGFGMQHVNGPDGSADTPVNILPSFVDKLRQARPQQSGAAPGAVAPTKVLP